MLADTTESIRNAYEVARALLTRTDRPDALVCFNDYIAREAINAAMDLGISIPGELAVTGFGNLPLCNLVRPRLSTVDQFSYETGTAAARLLLERISSSGKYERRDVVIDTKLIIRESNR